MRQALVVLRVLLFAGFMLAVTAPAHAQFRAEHAPATDPASLRIRQANVRDEHMVHFAERYREMGLVPAARAGSCGAAYRRVAAGALGRRLERYM